VADVNVNVVNVLFPSRVPANPPLSSHVCALWCCRLHAATARGSPGRPAPEPRVSRCDAREGAKWAVVVACGDADKAGLGFVGNHITYSPRRAKNILSLCFGSIIHGLDKHHSVSVWYTGRWLDRFRPRKVSESERGAGYRYPPPPTASFRNYLQHARLSQAQPNLSV